VSSARFEALLVASSKGAEAQQLMVDGALQHVWLGRLELQMDILYIIMIYYMVDILDIFIHTYYHTYIYAYIVVIWCVYIYN